MYILGELLFIYEDLLFILYMEIYLCEDLLYRFICFIYDIYEYYLFMDIYRDNICIYEWLNLYIYLIIHNTTMIMKTNKNKTVG